MPYQTYQKLIVWQKSIELALGVYRLTRPFPSDERYGLTSQLRRAAISVSNNIAEGHGRATKGEFLNALSVARGSANEVENCLVLSHRLQYADQRLVEPMFQEVDEIRRMLSRLRSQVKSS
jgi:four helix bundle protein